MSEEVMMEIQMLEQHMNQMQQHIQGLDEKIAEAQQLGKSLDELKVVKPGEEIMIPISNGIFATGKLTDVSKMRVNVGSGVVVEKTLEGTQALVEKQVVAMKKLKEQSQEQFQKLVDHAQELMQKIE
ncbi:prefoldin subunit alpha [Nanoarchaeota archaeon]